MVNNYINTLLVKFDNEISFSEIVLLRGAILNNIGNDVELLFHNHIGDSYRYAYPLIQYKRIHKKAVILCVGDGVESIGQFFEKQNFTIALGEKQIKLKIETIIPKRTIIQVWDASFKYNLRNWLALNSENYEKYKQLEGVSERIIFLEKILIGNILSFAKGVNVDITQQISCKILSLSEPRITTIKGVKMMAFDIEFKSNLSLPDYMGLGKHVSIGYGTIVRVYSKENNQ